MEKLVEVTFLNTDIPHQVVTDEVHLELMGASVSFTLNGYSSLNPWLCSHIFACKRLWWLQDRGSHPLSEGKGVNAGGHFIVWFILFPFVCFPWFIPLHVETLQLVVEQPSRPYFPSTRLLSIFSSAHTGTTSWFLLAGLNLLPLSGCRREALSFPTGLHVGLKPTQCNNSKVKSLCTILPLWHLWPYWLKVLSISL